MARVPTDAPDHAAAASRSRDGSSPDPLPDAHGQHRDISALGWTLLLVGLAALAGALVLPVRPVMLAPMAGALALVGLGLLRRAPWSRSAAIVLFAALIHGQLSRRWLESDLLRPFLEALRGVHEASLSAGPSWVTTADGASLGLVGAVCGALLCLVMGCFVVRLASHAVRSEFEPRQALPAQDRRGSSSTPSR